MKIGTIKHIDLKSSVRFDGEFHLSESVIFEKKIKRMDFKILDELVDKIFTAGRSKRVYTEKEFGFPYLSNSDIAKNNPFESCKYNSIKHAYDEPSFLKEGMIVTGRVGAIGQTAYINSEFEEMKAMGSDNIIRIIAKDKDKSGYIYSYLVSKYGNTFFHKIASGGVQPYISEDQVKDIPVPILPEEKQQQIHQLIVDSANLRVEANKLLKEAVELMESQLNTNTVTKGFQYKKITSKSFDYLHKRFDAQYQVMWKAIKDNYSDIEYKKIGDFAENIFVGNRGKRHYVNEGIPFLSSSDMMLFNPLRNSKQISKNSPGLESMKVQKKDILISRSGTVGNTVIVGDYLNNVAISEHALRLRIDSNLISPNYVFTYLKTNVGLKAMEASAFGSVIITLNEELIAYIDLPILSKDIVLKIDNLIDDYLIKLDSSTDKENQAINLIENEIDAWQ